MSDISTTDRYAVLLDDMGPVRLWWRTVPLAAERPGAAGTPLMYRDFPVASAAIERAAILYGQHDFHAPWLADQDGNQLTYGNELPALIADFLTRAHDTVDASRPSKWLSRLMQGPAYAAPQRKVI